MLLIFEGSRALPNPGIHGCPWVLFRLQRARECM